MKEISTLELLNEKSSYIKINKSKLADLEKMIELLNKRKSIINESNVKATEFEANEHQILLLKTDYELAKHHKSCIGIKAELQKYIDGASEVITEMESKWNEVIARAKKDADKKADIKAIIKSMDDVNFDENIDVKINYYVQLKSMVFNTGKPSLRKV